MSNRTATTFSPFPRPSAALPYPKHGRRRCRRACGALVYYYYSAAQLHKLHRLIVYMAGRSHGDLSYISFAVFIKLKNVNAGTSSRRALAVFPEMSETFFSALLSRFALSNKQNSWNEYCMSTENPRYV